MDTIILFIIVPTIRIHFVTIFICNYLTYIWLIRFYKIMQLFFIHNNLIIKTEDTEPKISVSSVSP